MKEGNAFDLRLEDCKGNVFAGGWKFVPGYKTGELELRPGDTLVGRQLGKKEHTFTPPPTST